MIQAHSIGEKAMARFESGTVVSLDSNEAVTLPGIRGATLRVTKGTLWLTHEGNPNDVVLRTGDNYVVESDGVTVVEALHDALFWVVGQQAGALRTPARATPKSALWSALAGLLMPPPRHHAPYA
jgi:hypothetical protein